MSESRTPSLAQLSTVKLALLAEQTRSHNEPILRADPIAIVGMGCRLPGGVVDPASFWQLLRAGGDAVREVPPGRWDAAAMYDPDPSAPGKMATRWGGFIEGVDRFDAAYFGILPREAQQMDPQQRLFLEVAMEALDHAGLPHEKLAGSRTGAFVASYYNEYSQLQAGDPLAIDARSLTGALHSVLVNRLSYLLDLRGPSVSIDTACSSSLVAIHLACQSLRHGECDLALAGGVSLMLTETPMILLSKVGFMAPDGRCKTFDASADGFGRGEGCSVLVLKRLADAVADGDRVLAVVRGSAVNQDGHSTVLAAPNGLAQQALIREALANAQLEPSRIGYVEAHGTGTALGDPIEVEALAATVGQPNPNTGPCLLGAAKANIGHLEAAAGATGVVKAVLVLQHGEVPPQPHFRALNPHISLDGTRLAVADRLTPWPAGAQPRCIGTSGFGVGGTNAHVILEEAPRFPAGPAPEWRGAPWLLPLSARSPAALRALAARWVDFLGRSADALPALCAMAGERRTHHDHRLAVVAGDAAGMIERLQAFAEERGVAGLVSGHRPTRGSRRIGFVFSGQGQQWLGMGRELMATEPVFRQALAEVDARLQREAGWSLLEALQAAPERSRLDDTEVAQPAIFAVQVALAALWAHWGLRPDGVVGHSVGEIAALHVGGVLSLDEAVRIVVQRARFMQRATGQGAMAAVGLATDAARARIATFGERLSVGAVNGPHSAVLSGEAEALAQVLSTLGREGVSQRALPVNYAFHSAQMRPHAEALVAALGTVRAAAPALPVYSTVSAAVLALGEVDAAYFGRNVRETVRFADAMSAMLDDGFDTFVEIAAHPVLSASIAECAAARGDESAVVAGPRRGRPEREAMLTACAGVYAAGFTPDWDALQGAPAPVLDLPAYPWQHERFWLRPRPAPLPSLPAAAPADEALLGTRLAVAGSAVFQARWPADALAWLADHRLGGRVLMPAAAMLEALRAAAAARLDDAPLSLENFTVERPLVLDEAAGTVWQTVAQEPDEHGAVAVALYRRDEGERWLRIARAVARAAAAPGPAPCGGDAPATDAAAFYEAFESLGANFGAAFRSVQALAASTAPGEGQARLGLPAAAGPASTSGCHAVLIDGALQACSAVLGGGLPQQAYLPLGVSRYTLWRPGAQRLRARVSAAATPGGSGFSADVWLFAEDGAPVARLEGVQFAAAGAALAAPAAQADPWLHEIVWEPVAEAAPVSGAEHPAQWLVAGEGAMAEAVVAALGAPAARSVAPSAQAVAAAVLDATGPAPLHLVLLEPTQEMPLARRCALPLQAVQVLARAGREARLSVVTVAAQPAGAVAPRPQAAAWWGLGAAIAVEHPELQPRLIDLDPVMAAEAPATLAAELRRGDAVGRIALRGAVRLAPRLRQRPAPATSPAPRQLALGADRTLNALRWVPARPADPGAGQLRLRVVAAGLNFRDVLMALGMIPDQQAFLGAECAGVVEAVGPGVTGVRPGDRVFGLAPGSLASHVLVPAAFVRPWPAELGSLELAASLPAAYLTAMLGLQRLAGLRAGQRVLVHAGAGGVGQAAIQLALRAGAQVFATAGSPAKRERLLAMGVTQVFDSRSPGFAPALRAATGGAGMDVVLNSLAGDFIAASVDTLADDGCFLELGKRDVWPAERFWQQRPNARYIVYDLGGMAAAEPSIVAPMLDELIDALRQGTLRPLPLRVFEFDEVGEAMRCMAQARHVGKLVLRAPVVPAPADAALVQAGAAYLVTGGLGALGLHSARWLVGLGARHLVLGARRAPDATAAAAIEALRAQGAQVRVVQADAADRGAMATVLDEFDAAGTPLRGVIHAAGQLDDAPLLHLDAARMANVLRGKAEGALVLDALTRGRPLDFFVVFSAAGAWLGPAGQGAYAAANAVLDALVHDRRAAGLPATSVAWGLWREGMAAGAAHEAWAARGLGTIDPAGGLARLERLLREQAAQALVLPIDWARFLAQPRPGLDLAPFGGLGARSASSAAPAASATSRADAWRRLPEAERRDAVIAHLAQQATAVIGLGEGSAIDARRPLKELGLDSLMAVELRNLLARSLGVALPATLLFDHPTLDALADTLIQRLDLMPPASAAAAAPVADRAREEVAALSDEDAEAQLLAELEGTAPKARR